MWWLTVAVEYGTAGEVTLVVVGAILGLVVARSIVAEADAHRLERPDRWWSPVCDACDAPLGATLTVCRSGHRQRRANTAILMLTPLTLAATSIAVPATTQTAWVLPAYWWFAAVVILLTVTDIDTKLIPNRILGPGTLVGVILLTIGAILAGSLGDLLRAAAAGALYLAAMVLLGLVARGALGFGDVKLAFLLGVFTGYLGWGQLAVAGLGAFILGGIVSIVLLATRRASRKDFIPFGPFMVAAAIIAVVFGDAIVDWYVG